MLLKYNVSKTLSLYNIFNFKCQQHFKEILSNAYGVKVIDNPCEYEYPTTRDAQYVDPVFVGRIRKNLAFDNGISLWCVADNLRIGAALNTVRICKRVIEMQLFGERK